LLCADYHRNFAAPILDIRLTNRRKPFIIRLFGYAGFRFLASRRCLCDRVFPTNSAKISFFAICFSGTAHVVIRLNQYVPGLPRSQQCTAVQSHGLLVRFFLFIGKRALKTN
jgi:hypothetical protein